MLWGRVVKYVLWKAEGTILKPEDEESLSGRSRWTANGWGLPFGGQNDNYVASNGVGWQLFVIFRNQREIDMCCERHHRRILCIFGVEVRFAVVEMHVQG